MNVALIGLEPTPHMASVSFVVVIVVSSSAIVVAAWPSLLRVATAPVVRLASSGRRWGWGRTIGEFCDWFGAPGSRVDGDDAEREVDTGGHGRREMAVVAVVAVVVACLQVVWIWRHRSLGTLDYDESRYVAGAYQFRTMLTGGDPGDMNLFYGPAVPLLSAVATVVGPLDVRTVISAQLLLSVGIAVSVTGVARRLTTPTAAVIAGIAVTVLPATIAASQVYLLVLGSAFALTAGMWALLASDHGTNGRIWLVGPLFALAPMSRGMTLGLLPVAAIASLLYVSTSGRGLRRGIVTLSVAAIALATYLLTWGRPMVNYVVGGLDAAGTQDPGIAERLSIRWNEVSDGFGRPLLVVGLVVAGIGLVAAVRRGDLVGPVRGNAVLATVVLVLGGGTVFMLGGYFGSLGFWDYPLMPLLVAVLVTFGAMAPRPVRVPAAAAGLGFMAYLALIALWVLPATAPFAASGLGRYRVPVYASYKGWLDPRYEFPHRSEQRTASREWDAVSLEIDDALRRIDDRSPAGFEVFYWGGSNFVQYTSRILAAEDGREAISFPSDFSEGDPWTDALVPTSSDVERVLLIPIVAAGGSQDGIGRSPAEAERARDDPAVRGNAELRRIAISAGWQIVDRIPLPHGDEMVIFAAP